MSPRGTKSAVKQNKLAIVRAVAQDGALSRTEIAQKTNLSASTVTTLVNNLIDEGVLTESSERVATAGRPQVLIKLNPSYGVLAIVELTHTQASLSLFDFNLNLHTQKQLARVPLEGQALVQMLASALEELMLAPLSRINLLGIGLLLSHDIQEQDLRVVYSTGYADASLSITDALYSKFRVPVLVETGQALTLTELTRVQIDPCEQNYVHVSFGERVLAYVVSHGRSIPLAQGSCADISALVRTQTQVNEAGLVNFLYTLSQLFHLDACYFSCSASAHAPQFFTEYGSPRALTHPAADEPSFDGAFYDGLSQDAASYANLSVAGAKVLEQIAHFIPKLQILEPSTSGFSAAFAASVRKKAVTARLLS